jgi:RNA polymerase sigma-70 factor (ECF subfamily)
MEEGLTQLIILAQEGDRDSYGKIYGIFYKRIYRYCHFNTQNRELSQDICQETFIKAWRAIPSFSIKKGGSLQAFFFRIARNLIIDNARKKKTASLENYENLASKEDLAENLDRKDENKKLKEAMAKLTEADKQIIILHYFEEMSGSEIAKVVGIREGALRVRTHRIIKKLKDFMEEND